MGCCGVYVCDYEYLKHVPIGGWAWEFVRRWPQYCSEHLSHKRGALKRTRVSNTMDILRLTQPEPDAAKYGLSLSTDRDAGVVCGTFEALESRAISFPGEHSG